MKAVLLFYRGNGPAAAFVRWFTKSKYAHVAPAITQSDGSAFAYDAYWSTGVAKRLVRPIEVGFTEIVYLPDLDTRAKQAWLDSQIGKPYDKWSIVIIGLTKRLPGWLHVYVSRQGEWICSRLSSVFAEIGTECWGLNGPPSPEDVHRIVTNRDKENAHARSR